MVLDSWRPNGFPIEKNPPLNKKQYVFEGLHAYFKQLEGDPKFTAICDALYAVLTATEVVYNE
jgi:hypothetical protein